MCINFIIYKIYIVVTFIVATIMSFSDKRYGLLRFSSNICEKNASKNLLLII